MQGAYHRSRILEDEVTNFGRPRPLVRVTNIGRLERRRGRGFCAEWQRVLKGKQVSDFGWDRARKVSNRAAYGVGFGAAVAQDGEGGRCLIRRLGGGGVLVAECGVECARRERLRGVMCGARGDSRWCCIGWLRAMAAEFGRCVGGSVTELGGCLLVGRWSRVGEFRGLQQR